MFMCMLLLFVNVIDRDALKVTSSLCVKKKWLNCRNSFTWWCFVTLHSSHSGETSQRTVSDIMNQEITCRFFPHWQINSMQTHLKKNGQSCWPNEHANKNAWQCLVFVCISCFLRRSHFAWLNNCRWMCKVQKSYYVHLYFRHKFSCVKGGQGLQQSVFRNLEFLHFLGCV